MNGPIRSVYRVPCGASGGKDLTSVGPVLGPERVRDGSWSGRGANHDDAAILHMTPRLWSGSASLSPVLRFVVARRPQIV